MTIDMTRRAFLRKSSLVIGVTLLSDRLQLFHASPAGAASNTPFRPHAFLEIAADDAVTVWVGQTNLGQGTHTGMAMVVADELDAAWETVRVRMAPAGEAFKSPVWHVQATGGSSSIRHRWDLLREVGAAARQMLVAAAALHWGIPADRLTAAGGKVLHPDGSSLTYGRLAGAAAKQPVPEHPVLKTPERYGIMGTARQRLDIPDKVMGKTVYGFDFTLPGLCVAAVTVPPRYGAAIESYRAERAMAVRGVIAVVPLERHRVAVCAENTYAALRGRDALEVRWSRGAMPDLDDESLDRIYAEHLDRPGAVAENSGDAEGGLAGAARTLEASYEVPYIAHAQMEPINCTAHVEKDRCRLWTPTQGQTFAQLAAAAITGLPAEKVEVMTLPAGGGFGLRAETDPVVDAVTISRALNRPVKVFATREDEFANDYFRPASRCRVKAGLDGDGRLVAWSHKVASQSVMSRLMPDQVKNGVDPDAVSGVRDLPYTVPGLQVRYVMVDLPVKVGWWRSVGYSVNVFTVESFMDELAHAAGKDPVRFRLDHLEKGSRLHSLLSLLASRGGWDSPLPEGRARGVAVSACFESFAAHMAEVSVGPRGAVSVHKMVCAIDCGTAVYPDAIRAQAEAGVVMGLSVAFHERVRFADGGVATANYHHYPLLTISEVPEIEVIIAEGHRKAGGVGEPVFPSVAPAVANAVFRATGVRLRKLPFDRQLLAGT